MSDPRRDRGPQRSGGSPQQRQQEPKLDSLWPGYLRNGYFGEAGGLRPELVNRHRMEQLAREMAAAHPGLTPHQARRFFQHCRAIESRLRVAPSSWPSEHEQVLKLDVFAADALAKPKIPLLFHEFIRANVERVSSEEQFLRGFLPHFEALLGFGAQFFNRNRERP